MSATVRVLTWTWSTENQSVADAVLPNRRLDDVLVGWPRPRPVLDALSVDPIGTEPVKGVTPSDHIGVIAELRHA